jgi:hypothetical protein
VARSTLRTWESTAALVQDVQGWLDAPTTNFGWLLINTSEGTARSQKAFYSRDAAELERRDELVGPDLAAQSDNHICEFGAPGDYNGNGVVDGRLRRLA